MVCSTDRARTACWRDHSGSRKSTRLSPGTVETAPPVNNGAPVLREGGYARLSIEYDERGNEAVRSYAGKEGALVPGAEGCAVLRASYDERGRVIEESCFDAGGRPVAGKHGYARRTTAYDERGNVRERALFTGARPALVLITTPNCEYNQRFEHLPAGAMRHSDHRFEWTRAQFSAWATAVAARNNYTVEFTAIGPVDPELGAPTQMGAFRRCP